MIILNVVKSLEPKKLIFQNVLIYWKPFTICKFNEKFLISVIDCKLGRSFLILQKRMQLFITKEVDKSTNYLIKTKNNKKCILKKLAFIYPINIILLLLFEEFKIIHFLF